MTSLTDEVGGPVNLLRESVQKLVQWRRLLASAAFALITIGLCAHVLLGNNGWVKYRAKKAEYQQLQQDLKRMDDDKQRLDSEIKALKSDPKAIEKEAREQLRYAKPGEIIYLLPEQAVPHPAQPPQQPESARR
jgi:cell division protein FtsB